MKKCKSVGSVVNGLIVIGTEKRGTHTYYKVRCVHCGKEAEKRGETVMNGQAKCECQYTTEHHGQSRTPLYRAWEAMKRRCADENHESYKDYGGRGITVCEEWENSFTAFFNWSMENGYKDGLTIDRKNNEQGYSPDNCRWTTAKVQCNNRRSNRVIEYNGKSQTLAEWAEELGINYSTLKSRMNQMKWSVEKAFETPVRG